MHLPTFDLEDVIAGGSVTNLQFVGSPLVVTFICNHCPFVVHVEKQLASIEREYRERGVGWVAISSNETVNRPQDGPDGMREQAARAGFEFPYLFDEAQDVARAFGAACTPDTFVFDSAGDLVYRGQIDGARPRNDIAVDGSDLREALTAVIEGKQVSPEQRNSVGCGIKWKE